MLVGGVDDLVRTILSATGFRQFSSVKNVSITHELLTRMTEIIRELEPESTFYKSIETLTEKKPEKFILFPGSEATIKNIFTELNKLDVAGFDEHVELIVIDDVPKQNRKRSSMGSGESSAAKQVKLSTDEQILVLKDKIREIIAVANPSINIANIEIQLTPQTANPKENSTVFKTPCYACNNNLTVSISIMPSGYIQYRVDGYTKHLLNAKRHPEEAARIRDKKVNFF